MNLTLTRTSSEPDGTFGALAIPLGQSGGTTTLCTVEDDWLDNRPGVSCIPAGTYRLHRTVFHKHNYETFEVCDVPGRSRILIHPANTENDVEGCIGVGLRFGRLLVPRDEDTGQLNVEKKAVVASQDAFRRFMAAMTDVDNATLTVKWAPGLPPAKGGVA